MPQPYLRQQPGFNDMSLLQQHSMFKQFQELQRQHQLQQFGDVRQQNPVSQLPMIMKQATGGQFPPMIHRTPVHGASQVFMNWMPHNSSPSAQGVPDQQPDVSLYGTPIARGHLSHSSYLQGVQKPTMQLSTFSSPLLGDQHMISQEQVCTPDEAFTSKQGFQKRNPFAQAPHHSLYDGVLPENSEQGTIMQKNASVQELNGTKGRGALPLAALDPMEQKILFSMDENIWDATFGKQNDIDSGSFGKTLEHPDDRNVFPYCQSGSYSALMQSAVAEASSSDTDLQEWSGLTFQNTDFSTENQLLGFVDSGKQPIGLAGNNIQSSSFCSKLSPVYSDSNVKSSFPGIKQPGSPFSMEQREGAHRDSSHESIQRSPDGKWFNLNQQEKSPIEESQQFQPLELLENAWTGQIYQHSKIDVDQKSMPVLNNSTMPCNSPKVRSIDSSPRCGNGTLGTGDKVKNLENCWTGNISGVGYKRTDIDGCLWNTDGNTLLSRQGSQVSTFSDLPNSNAMKSIQETREHAPDSPQLDYMKEDHNTHVKCKENENMETGQHQVDNGPQSLNCSDKGAENRQNCYQKENSPSDSYNSNLSQHSMMGHEVRENVWLNAGDYQAVARGSQKPPSQFLCSPGLRSPDQEYFGQLKSTGRISDSVMCLEKGQLPDFQGNLKPSAEVDSRGNLGSNMSGAGDRLAGFHGSGISAQTSQDMLEFLHRQSGESNAAPHFQVPKEQNPDGSLAQPYDQSYASQQPDLRLDPQLPQLSNSNCLSYSQGLPQMENTLMPVKPTSTPRSRNQLHGQLISNTAVAHQLPRSTSSGRLLPFNLTRSQDASQLIFAHSSGQQFPVLQQSGSLVSPPNLWTKIPTQQHLSADELRKGPFTDPSNNSSGIPSLVQREPNVQNLPKDANESSIGAQTGNSVQPVEFAATSLETHLHQPEFGKLQYGSNQDPALSRKEFDAFGRSLKPSVDVGQNYTPLHQAQVMNNLNPETGRMVKNQNEHQAALIAGQESLYQHTTGVGNSMDNKMHAAQSLNPCTSRDIGMELLMSGLRADQTVQPILQRLPSLETANFGLNDPRRHSSNPQMGSNHRKNSQNSAQDAPNWFKQYENFRNGQMLPTYNAKLERLSQDQVFQGKASDNLNVHSTMEQVYANADQVDSSSTSTAAGLVGSEHLQKPYILTSGVTDQILSVMRPKKRKIETSVLLPWHKEVIDGSQTLENISTAAQDWARTTNCLVEKEDGAYVIAGSSPMARSKRRLTMTTHLMQQLLRPAPLAILEADSISKHDCVLYSVAKLALGDACSLSSCMKNDSENTMSSEKLRRISDHDFSKAMEDFTSRAKNLENHFLRLDKKVSVLDIRLECQEMEKYSVMNRFAKFHSRVQADRTESTSSSSTAVTAPRPFLQRYVLAVPMPGVLPEHTKCLSL